MIEFIIFQLQVFKYAILILGIGSTILMLLIVADDLSLGDKLSSIRLPRFQRRVGRHRRTIKTAILERYGDLFELIVDIRVEKAVWRKEKEAVARGVRFFDLSNPSNSSMSKSSIALR